MPISLLQILQEIGFEKVYHTRGLLVTNPQERGLGNILSDIRSLLGVTTVRVEELPNQNDKEDGYKSILNIKIDPYPFIKSDQFTNAQSEETVAFVRDQIQRIEGVKSIRFSSKIDILDN